MPGSSSSGSTTSSSKRRSKLLKKVKRTPEANFVEYELGKNGELVPALLDSDSIRDEDDDSNNEITSGKKSEPSNAASSRSKRKQTFERKNIKRVIETNDLSEEARSAQKAEMERLQRLQMKDQSHFRQFNPPETWKVVSADAVVSTPFLPPFQASQPSSRPEDSKEDTKLSIEESGLTASQRLFKQKQVKASQPGDTEESAIILLDDSEDDVELPIKLMNNQVIELSDDDDDGVIAIEDEAEAAVEEEEEVQAEFCELRDAQNLPDAKGRICIRRGATDAESFYLAPHIARVIKPHQVSGVRFLFDNLIENQSQFERSSGFGCILAHSMGLGKSIQVIAFLDLIFRYCRPAAHTVLLIVPINTLQNWQTEFQTWLPSTLYSSDDEKPKVAVTSTGASNGSYHSTLSTASAPQQLLAQPPPPSPVGRSEPSLLSLINDSFPLLPQPMDQSQQPSQAQQQQAKEEPGGEPQFPPPPPTSSTAASPASRVEQPKVEEPSPPAASREPAPFRLHVIKDTTKSLDARYQVVLEWARVGGVLLMGYEMFRLLTTQRKQPQCRVNSNANSFPNASSFTFGSCSGSGVGFGSGIPMSASANALFPQPVPPANDAGKAPPPSKRRKRTITIDIDKEEKEEYILHDMRVALTDPGPQIVICDEGHRIKNSEASTSKALKALKTKRRVVLTGYPLQNNLMEYWCMVDFVRPNYLGTKAEFTNMFQRPIENGQCVDSTEADRKLMQGRAHVLHELLAGFVQRRSHAVLKASLPPKQEVVLMVRMSPLQRRLYTALMTHISNASSAFGNALPTANTLQTYALCCKIWNHPDILWRVINENVDETLDFEADDVLNAPNGASNPRAKRKGSGNNSTQISGTSSSNGEDKYGWVNSDLWGADFKAGDVHNSGKIILFLSLLFESVRVGDKMLLFSQSLLTLDLIERLLGRLPLDCERPPSPTQTQEQMQQQQMQEEEEETEKTIHYRMNRRLGNDPKQPSVWVRNVHYFRLDGSTSPSDRDRLIRRFNDPKNSAKLFLVSTRAGSLGVNLVGANRVVVFDASWNPCHDCQAVCRVYRYGQEKPSYVYRLVSDNTMERKIYDRQVNKQGVSDRVVDEMNPGQQFTRAQVGVLMAYEDKDMPSLSDEDLQSISELTDNDNVLKAVLERNKEWVTTKPFTHESLLIDRKDYRLTRVEKRRAYERYKEERKMSAMYRSSGNYMANFHQQVMASMGFPFSNPAYNPNAMAMGGGGQRAVPNILSRGGNVMHHQGVMPGNGMFVGGPAGVGGYPGFLQADADAAAAATSRRYEGINRSRMLQKDLDEARIRSVAQLIGIPLPSGPLGSDYKITRVAASTDLIFPQSEHPPAPERSISKGEIVEIFQVGSHGKYLRLPRTNDIYFVKPGAREPSSEPNGSAGGNEATRRRAQQQTQPQQGHVQLLDTGGSASAAASSSIPPLCPRCRHPASPSCLCTTATPTAPGTTSSYGLPNPPMASSNGQVVSSNSAASAATSTAYHPPTYTNQYAPVPLNVPTTISASAYDNIASAYPPPPPNYR